MLVLDEFVDKCKSEWLSVSVCLHVSPATNHSSAIALIVEIGCSHLQTPKVKKCEEAEFASAINTIDLNLIYE